MHATEFLKSPEQHDTGPVVALYGPQRYLRQAALDAVKRLVLGPGEDDDVGLTRVDGEQADFRTLADELATVSMWGGRRLVVVEDADSFVTDNRPALERYVAKPSKRSVLVLSVKTWPATTRLAKAVASAGLSLECTDLKGRALERWLNDAARAQHGKTLAPQAVRLMLELAGSGLGLLDQELSKLAAYVGERPRIEADDVAKLVGGWKAETTWTMLDALQEGNLSLALSCLDKLLVAGEAPQMIMGGLSFRFRQLAQATERARQGTSLSAALKQAGVFGNKIAISTQYLRRIGRPRAERLFAMLLEADADLKGDSRLTGRLRLEQLLVELSGACGAV